MNVKYIIFGCTLLLVLLLSISISCNAIPYSATTRPYAIFEGLETKAEFNNSVSKLLDELTTKNTEIQKKITDIRKSDYSLKDKLKDSLKGLQSPEISDRVGKFINENMPDSDTLKSEQEETNKEGFENMSRPMDIFSSTVGGQKCAKTASGLSNSMGPLCLSNEQLYMLQSRGGNSTGRDSQIGM